ARSSWPEPRWTIPSTPTWPWRRCRRFTDDPWQSAVLTPRRSATGEQGCSRSLCGSLPTRILSCSTKQRASWRDNCWPCTGKMGGWATLTWNPADDTSIIPDCWTARRVSPWSYWRASPENRRAGTGRFFCREGSDEQEGPGERQAALHTSRLPDRPSAAAAHRGLWR